MSNDCKECLIMLQEQKKRKSLNQMSDEERKKYWEGYRMLIENTDKTELVAPESTIGNETCHE